MSDEPQKIKKFYRDAGIVHEADQFAVALDGKIAKTLRRRPLATQSEPLAMACAEEWNAQEEFIDRESMPLTALLSAAIDGGEPEAVTWRGEALHYLQTDLVCYRADEPAALLEKQNESWDPYLRFVEEKLGAPLNVTAGIIAVEQPEASRSAIKALLETTSTEVAFGLNKATAILGSCVLALSLWKGLTSPEDIFTASRVDEDFQEGRWGVDAEAQARAERLQAEFNAVARFIALSEQRG